VQRLSKSGRIISISITESFDNGVTGRSVAMDFSGGDTVLQQALITKVFKAKGRFLTGFDTVQWYNVQSLNSIKIQSGTIQEPDTARVVKFTFLQFNSQKNNTCYIQ
jgi:hypothetical protein